MSKFKLNSLNKSSKHIYLSDILSQAKRLQVSYLWLFRLYKIENKKGVYKLVRNIQYNNLFNRKLKILKNLAISKLFIYSKTTV